MAASFAFAEEPAVRISFSAETVRVEGVTSGGDVVIFAATLSQSGGMQTIGRRAEVIADSDGDGAVALTVSAIPTASVWAAVDFTTGRHSIAAPQGFPLRRMDIPEHGWRRGLEHFELRRGYLEVLVVRPGAGAWTLRAAEGGSNDDDGALNATLRTRLSKMHRLHGPDTTPRPPVIVPKDFLLVIDPHELDFFTSEAQ